MIVANNGVPIEVSDRGEVGVKSYVQNKTSRVLDIPFTNELGQTALAAAAVVDSYEITLTTGHGVVSGDLLEMTDGKIFFHATVLSVSVDSITLDTPVDYPYPSGALVRILSNDLTVDGSASPISYKVLPNESQSGDFSRIVITITDNTDMDFEGFGGLAALTRGIILRINNGDGTYRTIKNFKSNGDIEHYAFNDKYFENNGASVRGFTALMTFSGNQNHGAAIRLDGVKGESLEILVQDDLTGLLSFHAIAQGAELQI